MADALTSLFVITAALYAVAGALSLVFLARGDERLSRGGTLALVVAALSHGGYVALDAARLGSVPLTSIHDALAIASLLVIVVYLVILRGRPRLAVLGAFVTPVTLLLFLGAGLRRGVGAVPDDVRSMLLPLHVAVNVLGIVAFALAFGVAVAYMVQERQLRKKQLGGIFQRLPPLDVLDGLGFRLVAIGFPLFTLGVVSGTLWAVRLDPAPIGAAQTFGVLAWLMFAAVLLLRVAAGWRGRRAALGTMAGFACACAVLVSYWLRGTGA